LLSDIIRHNPSQNVFRLIPRPFQCLCPSQNNHAILPLVVSASTSFSSSAFFQYGRFPYSPGSLLSMSLKAAVFGASRGTERCSSRMPSPRYVESRLSPRTLLHLHRPAAPIPGAVLDILLHSLQICRWALSYTPRESGRPCPSLQTYYQDWSRRSTPRRQ
jgi:hypothetical protein